MANITLVQAINLALVQEMEKDDRVLVLGEDVGLNGGVFRVTDHLQKKHGLLDDVASEEDVLSAHGNS